MLPRRHRRQIWWWAAAAAGLLLAVYLGTPEARLTGQTRQVAGEVERVVDGDTFDLAGHRIRLAGIDAPERDQTCTTAAGELWRCGDVARARLRELVRAATVQCQPRTYDRYGRVVAQCEVRDRATELGRQLVREGLALATEGYLLEQADASLRHIGLWQGRFERPSDWRRHSGSSEEGAGAPSRFDRFISWLGTLVGS